MKEVGSLLFRTDVPVTDRISIMIPTVGEILADEDNYYTTVGMLTAMPIDFMVQLDDIGVDFTTINDYDLFLMLSQAICEKDTRLLFGDLDMSNFSLGRHIETGAPVLYDEDNDLVIDRVVHTRIANTLRKIHHLEKNNKQPGNEDARQYMIERARIKAERAKRRKRRTESQLEPLIVAMVNTEQYKYGYRETQDLTIYQFNESVRQIQHKVDYDNRMFGIYSGSLDPKSLDRKDLNWLIHQ